MIFIVTCGSCSIFRWKKCRYHRLFNVAHPRHPDVSHYEILMKKMNVMILKMSVRKMQIERMKYNWNEKNMKRNEMAIFFLELLDLCHLESEDVFFQVMENGVYDMENVNVKCFFCVYLVKDFVLVRDEVGSDVLDLELHDHLHGREMILFRDEQEIVIFHLGYLVSQHYDLEEHHYVLAYPALLLVLYHLSQIVLWK